MLWDQPLTGSAVRDSEECSFGGSSGVVSVTLVCSFGAFGVGCACFSPLPEDKIQAI